MICCDDKYICVVCRGPDKIYNVCTSGQQCQQVVTMLLLETDILETIDIT